MDLLGNEKRLSGRARLTKMSGQDPRGVRDEDYAKTLQPPVAPALQGVGRCGLITSPSNSEPLLSVQRKLSVEAIKCSSWSNERPVLAFPRLHMMDKFGSSLNSLSG